MSSQSLRHGSSPFLECGGSPGAPHLGSPHHAAHRKYLRVPHPSRLLRRVGSYAPTPRLLFSSFSLFSSLRTQCPLRKLFLASWSPVAARLPPHTCHPDPAGRDPTFSSAPRYGASGLSPSCHPDRSNGAFCRCAVEGSWHDFKSRPPSPRCVMPIGIRAARYGFASHAFCAMNPCALPLRTLRPLRLCVIFSLSYLCALCVPISVTPVLESLFSSPPGRRSLVAVRSPPDI